MKNFLIGSLILGASMSVQAGLVNGGFETGTLNGWSSLGSVTVSSGQSYGSAGSVAPSEGSSAAKLVTSGATAAAIAAAMSVTEATLEASNGGLNATNGALIYQSVYATAGDSFDFNWNFVEQDYLPYDDWAFYGIQFENNATDVTKFASLGSVGPGSGTTINGWETLTVDITQTGNYTFYFGIVNAIDTVLDSNLWIDGVSVTSVPEPSIVALMGLGLVGMGFSRRKQKK